MRRAVRRVTVIDMVESRGGRLWVVSCVLLVAAVNVSAAQLATARETASGWVVTDLGTGHGWSVSTEHMTVNNHGQVLGLGGLWENGKLSSIRRLGGMEGEALALNERGQVVGWSDTRKRAPATGHAFAHRAFLWQGGRMRDLVTLGGEGESGGSVVLWTRR